MSTGLGADSIQLWLAAQPLQSVCNSHNFRRSDCVWHICQSPILRAGDTPIFPVKFFGKQMGFWDSPSRVEFGVDRSVKKPFIQETGVCVLRESRVQLSFAPMKVMYLTDSIMSTFPKLNQLVLLAQPHQTVTFVLSWPSCWFTRVPVPVLVCPLCPHFVLGGFWVCPQFCISL